MSEEKKIPQNIPSKPEIIPNQIPEIRINEGFEKAINRGERGDLRMPVFEIPPIPPTKDTKGEG